MNILITAASTATAYKLEKELAGSNSLILADSVDLPSVLIKDKRFIKIPPGNSSSFTHQLLSLCLDEGIERVFPLRRAEIEALSESRQLFDEYGIAVMVPLFSDLSSYWGNSKTGEILIKEEDDEFAGRGVYLIEEGSLDNLQILTAD
ncbi:hypothetical protein [Desertivirga brevis]|uniref:hypothetical protein n=1 Tax=Desertivirga brevis TaxID=2810310 RepID=UPI001A975F92|nr:hypothetical protein [Pedobacter sp. SYSU D00873]